MLADLCDVSSVCRYDPNRKIKLHNQLVRARRLRAVIEDAASRADALPDNSPESYSQAMEILQSTAPYINELTRLTEALLGGYTLNDHEYNEWNAWTEKKNEEDEEGFMRDQRILRRELREWGKETNPNFQMDAELEKRHDALIYKRKAEPLPHGPEISEDVIDWDVLQQSRDSGKYKVRNNNCEDKKKRRTARRESNDAWNQTSQRKYKAHRDDDANIQTAGKKRQRRMSNRTSNQSAGGTIGMPLMNNDDYPSTKPRHPTKRPSIDTKGGNREKKVKIERSSLKHPPELCMSLPAPAGPSSKPTSLGRAPKKCHDCKETTSHYRKCSYWQVNGNKCGKFFCVECLSSKYTLGDDVLSDNNTNGIPIDEIVKNKKYDAEWHCPSCLKTCLCASCVKRRHFEDEKERVRKQGERRSGRRSTGHSDYSNFFKGGGVLF
jgi:hypothetical protein